MNITRVTAWRHRGESANPYSAEIVIVEVDTDGDIVGMGFANAPPRMGTIIAQMVENVFGPAAVGSDPRLTSDLWTRLQGETVARRGGDGIARGLEPGGDGGLGDRLAQSGDADFGAHGLLSFHAQSRIDERGLLGFVG